MSQSVDKRQLSQQAIHGTFWTYLSFVAGKSLTFVTTVILARLLLPEQFGLVGYCLIAIQYLDTLNSFGVGSALISRRDKLEEAANAAFTISAGMSLMLFGFAWVTAPAIARFFKEDSVTQLFRVLAISLPISAIGTVPSALLHRSLRFKAKIIPDLGRNIIRGLVSIILARNGFGVWSLILGDLAGDVTVATTLLVLARWRPRLVFDRQVTREILSFGAHITFVGLAGGLLNNIDYLLVGRILGAAALGYYTLAYRIPELIIRNTIVVIDKVAYPLLSQLQSDAQKLRSVYFAYIRYISLFTFPTGLGLSLIAPHFIRTFYPAIWEPAIPVMQCIPIAIAISSVGYVPGVIYKATNRPHVLSRLALLKLPITITVLWYSTRWGIVGVAAAQILVALLLVTFDSLTVSRIVNFRLDGLWTAIGPALAGTAIMGLIVAAATWVAPNGIWGLAMLGLVGVATYMGALAIVSRETLIKASGIVRTALTRL